MRTYAPALLAVLLVVGSGLVHGRLTNRWAVAGALQDRLAALQRVPTTIDSWQGQDLPVDDRVMAGAEILGYVSRQYERPDGDRASVMIVCGRPGPICVHTPEICYPGTGYVATGATRKSAVAEDAAPGDGDGDSCWLVEFARPDDPPGGGIRVYYTWSNDGTWRASDSPRVDFGGGAALYKLYVVRERQPDGEGDAADLEFLRQLLPELSRSLFDSSPRPAL